MTCSCIDGRDDFGSALVRWLRSNLSDALRNPALGRAVLGLPDEVAYVHPARVASLAHLRFLRSRPSEGGCIHRVQIDARVEFLVGVPRVRRLIPRVRQFLEDASLIQTRAVALTAVLDLFVLFADEPVAQVRRCQVVAVSSDLGEVDYETGESAAAV